MNYFTYVFPCVWEDHCKVGFSKDPLVRLQQFHRRWFEFFDVERIRLIVSESKREARELELQLRRPLKALRAPMPLTISKRAGGHTEWLRGSYATLQQQLFQLGAEGYRVDSEPQTWLRAGLLAQSDRLFAWTHEMSPLAGEEESPGAADLVVDALDQYGALDLEVAPFLAAHVLAWYQPRSLLCRRM